MGFLTTFLDTDPKFHPNTFSETEATAMDVVQGDFHKFPQKKLLKQNLITSPELFTLA